MSECTYCQLIEKKANMLFEDEKIFVMLAPDAATPGHVLILPKGHSPIFETIPDPIAAQMFKVANKLSLAVFDGLGAQGTNVLMQNGPPAGQTQNHVILHVLPRFEGDQVQLTWIPKPSSEEQLTKYESSIKAETKNVGIFEKEKPKPIEREFPKEIPKSQSDYRIKKLRRIP